MPPSTIGRMPASCISATISARPRRHHAAGASPGRCARPTGRAARRGRGSPPRDRRRSIAPSPYSAWKRKKRRMRSRSSAMRCVGIADEADAAGDDVGVAADRIVDRAAGIDRERVDGEIAAAGIRRPVAAEADDRVAAVGLDVLAQRRHLEAAARDDQRHRAVLDAGRHHLDAGGLGQRGIDLVGRRGRGEIDSPTGTPMSALRTAPPTTRASSPAVRRARQRPGAPPAAVSQSALGKAWQASLGPSTVLLARFGSRLAIVSQAIR